MMPPMFPRIEVAIQRDWDYLQRSENSVFLDGPQNAMKLIWMEYGRCKANLEHRQVTLCLQNVLRIAAIADAFRNKTSLETATFKPYPPVERWRYTLEERISHLYHHVLKCDNTIIPAFDDDWKQAVNKDFFFLKREAVAVLIEHGLYERTGGTETCRCCLEQIKRMAHQDGENWFFYWGCDNDCQDKGYVLGNSSCFDEFNMRDFITTNELVLAGYQIV